MGMGTSGTSDHVRKNQGRWLSKHNFGPVATLHGIRFPNWKWSLRARQGSKSQGSNYVGVVPGTLNWILVKLLAA